MCHPHRWNLSYALDISSDELVFIFSDVLLHMRHLHRWNPRMVYVGPYDIVTTAWVLSPMNSVRKRDVFLAGSGPAQKERVTFNSKRVFRGGEIWKISLFLLPRTSLSTKGVLEGIQVQVALCNLQVTCHIPATLTAVRFRSPCLNPWFSKVIVWVAGSCVQFFISCAVDDDYNICYSRAIGFDDS